MYIIGIKRIKNSIGMELKTEEYDYLQAKSGYSFTSDTSYIELYSFLPYLKGAMMFDTVDKVEDYFERHKNALSSILHKDCYDISTLCIKEVLVKACKKLTY